MRYRIETLGLAEDDLDCVRMAAGGECEVLAGGWSMVGRNVEFSNGTVRVASLAYVEAMQADSATAVSLSSAHLVLLISADASGERQRWVARAAANARIVITKIPGTILTLHEALRTVRHRAVAEALVERLGTARDDLPDRALVAAVRLAPVGGNVPALSRVLHMTERTLRRKLDAACPAVTPLRLLNWACLLHAAWHLTTCDDSVARVAQQVGASAPSNLHRLVRAYTGYSAANLRSTASDPISTVIAACRAELSRPKSWSPK